MEIGQQPSHHAELVSRVDENVRFERPGSDSAVGRLRSAVLERPRACGSDCNYAPALIESAIDGLRGGGRNLADFAVQLVILDALHPHRLEGSKPDVQSDRGGGNASGLDARKNFPGEVQPGGGGGHRTWLARIDRLVAIAISQKIPPVDIGRQRHMAEAVEPGKKVGHRSKSNPALSEAASGHDLGFEFVVLAKEQSLADADFTSGADQALPFVSVLGDSSGEQNLHFAAQEFAPGRVARACQLDFFPAPAAKEACRKDSRIITYEQVACP